MDLLQTIVNEERLDDWCRDLPDCELFLENFFCSCRQYTWETNFLNYVRDVEVHADLDPTWQKYEGPLLQAFLEITGYGGTKDCDIPTRT
ncbi:hypothetical protein ACFL3V_03720 [Nanoarchaeota archaeon]